MYSGKYKKKRFNPKFLVVLSLLLCMMVTVGGTLAWLTTGTESVVNTFEPSSVDCEVKEVFDGTNKSSIQVENTSDIKAYIRVKLVTYRVNDQGQHIGGEVAALTHENVSLNSSWFYKDGFFYCRTAIDPRPDSYTPNLLSSPLKLVEYDDVDGGKQVIEVMAEAIQADGKDSNGKYAVETVWGVTVVGVDTIG